MSKTYQMSNFRILSTTNSPSPHHISLFSGGNVALQNGASSVGNLYNNPIAAEAQYMQQQGHNSIAKFWLFFFGSKNGLIFYFFFIFWV